MFFSALENRRAGGQHDILMANNRYLLREKGQSF